MNRLIRANRLSCANHCRVEEMNPFFWQMFFGALKVANRMFEAIRANRSNVLKLVFSVNQFARIDSSESPGSRRKSPGHLRIDSFRIGKASMQSRAY